MLLERNQDKVPFYGGFETIRFRDIDIVDQTLRILNKDLLPDTDLYSMTLFNFVQKFFVPTNS